MKNTIIGLFIGGLVAVGVGAGTAHAMTPTLSVYSQNNNDTVTVTVNGDANASAYLYYQKSGYGTQSYYLGMTSYSGYLSTSVNTSSLGVSTGSSVYVIVNGQQSSSVTWPYTNYYYGGSVVVSPSSVTVAVGQSINVTVSGGSQPYTMYPAAYNLFQSALSGNTLTITGTAAGSSNLNVCSSGASVNSSSCTNLYITVTNQYNYTGTIYNPSGWTFCGNENQWCSFSGTQTVQYGVNGAYYYRTYTGGVSCSNASFGDPAYGVYKQCWYGGTIPSYATNPYTYSPYTSSRTEVLDLERLLQDAVRRFQASRGLNQTGIIDAATRAELNR